MNREEKNMQTRRRILDSAMAEFAEQGYGASSVNTISSAEGLSKGIIYHYFETKDDLYLACVGECFQKLCDYIREKENLEGQGVAAQLESYFRIRLLFFQEHPVCQRIFCGAVVTPPSHLADAIKERKASFDAQNVEILSRLLEPVVLRPEISKGEVIEMFRQYQDFINAGYQMNGARDMDICEHERSCHRALDILLYGVIMREEKIG